MTSKNTLRATLPVAAILSTCLAIAGCSGAGDEEDTGAQIEANEEEPAAAEEPAEDEAATEAPAGDEAQVEIGETIEDPDMGDTIEILSAIRDFQSEEEAERIADGGEVVLLEVQVAPGEEYGGLVSIGDFEISWDDGADFWNNQTRMIEEEMEAADHPVMEDVSRRDGGEHTGWIAFFVDERSDSYLLRYERGGAEVIGSDETIEAFTEEFEIPPPQ